MTKKRKNTILLIAAVVLIVGSTGGYYVYNQKYESLLKATKRGLTTGKAYGKLVAQSECTQGLIIQYGKCKATECELSANAFIVGCMETATGDKMCENLPTTRETKKSLAWAENTCNSLRLGKTRCEKYIHKFISYCTEHTEKRKRSSAEIARDGFNKGLMSDPK